MTGLQNFINAFSWLFTALATIMVALRLLSRTRLKNVAGWDDVVIVIALVVYVATSVVGSISISHGTGLRLKDLDPADAIDAAKWIVITDSVGVLSFTIPKLSVAILLIRILTIGHVSRAKAALLCTPAAIVILISLVNVLLGLGQCRPLEAAWNKRISDAECLNPKIYWGFGLSLGVCSTAADFFYALYPVFIIFRLNTSKQRKIHLSLMLGLGVIGGFLAIWKTVEFAGLYNEDVDITYRAGLLNLSNEIETGVLIIAACVPTVAPVFRACKDYSTRTFGRSKGTGQFQQLDEDNDSKHVVRRGGGWEHRDTLAQYELRDM